MHDVNKKIKIEILYGVNSTKSTGSLFLNLKWLKMHFDMDLMDVNINSLLGKSG